MTSQLMAPVHIRAGKKAGVIEIRYVNNEELNRLALLLLGRT